MVKFNDKLGHRGLYHKNVLAVVTAGIFVEFAGETIPGVVRVVRSDYSKNGKWSHSTWDCELAEGIVATVHPQDWETGEYFNSATWPLAIAEFLRRFPDLSGPTWEAAVERFIRATYARSASRLDAEASRSSEAAPIAELIAAQEQLATAQRELARAKSEVGQLLAAREAEELAAELTRKTAAVTERLAGARKLSLADLQDLYRQL